jgi:hypothetical protein
MSETQSSEAEQSRRHSEDSILSNQSNASSQSSDSDQSVVTVVSLNCNGVSNMDKDCADKIKETMNDCDNNESGEKQRTDTSDTKKEGSSVDENCANECATVQETSKESSVFPADQIESKPAMSCNGDLAVEGSSNGEKDQEKLKKEEDEQKGEGREKDESKMCEKEGRAEEFKEPKLEEEERGEDAKEVEEKENRQPTEEDNGQTNGAKEEKEEKDSNKLTKPTATEASSDSKETHRHDQPDSASSNTDDDTKENKDIVKPTETENNGGELSPLKKSSPTRSNIIRPTTIPNMVINGAQQNRFPSKSKSVGNSPAKSPQAAPHSPCGHIIGSEASGGSVLQCTGKADGGGCRERGGRGRGGGGERGRLQRSQSLGVDGTIAGCCTGLPQGNR